MTSVPKKDSVELAATGNEPLQVIAMFRGRAEIFRLIPIYVPKCLIDLRSILPVFEEYLSYHAAERFYLENLLSDQDKSIHPAQQSIFDWGAQYGQSMNWFINTGVATLVRWARAKFDKDIEDDPSAFHYEIGIDIDRNDIDLITGHLNRIYRERGAVAHNSFQAGTARLKLEPLEVAFSTALEGREQLKKRVMDEVERQVDEILDELTNEFASKGVRWSRSSRKLASKDREHFVWTVRTIVGNEPLSQIRALSGRQPKTIRDGIEEVCKLVGFEYPFGPQT